MKTPRKLLIALLAGSLVLAGCSSGDDASAEAPAEQQDQADNVAEDAQNEASEEPETIGGRPTERVCEELGYRLDQVDNNWGAALALQYRETLPNSYLEEAIQRAIDGRDAMIDECLPEDGQQWWSGDARDRIDDTVNGLVEHDLLYGSEHLLALTYIGHPHHSLFTDEERAEAGFEFNQQELDRFISIDNQQELHQAAIDLVRADRGQGHLLSPWNPEVDAPPIEGITGTGDYADVCAPETFINGPPESEWIVDDFDSEIVSYMQNNWEPVYEEACQFTLEH